MTYANRYILNLQPNDIECTRAADSIKSKTGCERIDAGNNCLSIVSENDLLTIVGHGAIENKVIASQYSSTTSSNASSSSSSSTVPTVQFTEYSDHRFIEGEDLARLITKAFGLKSVRMITLVSCNAGRQGEGFASVLHRSLGANGLKTNLNSRTGYTEVIYGQQWVKESKESVKERGFGTKRLHYWKDDVAVSTLECLCKDAPEKEKIKWTTPRAPEDSTSVGGASATSSGSSSSSTRNDYSKRPTRKKEII